MVKDDDEAQRILRQLMENLGEASEVLHGLGEYLEYIEYRGQRVLRKLIRGATIIVLGFVIALALTGIAIDRAHDEANNAHREADNAKRSVLRNSLAIRVGCTLLANAIVSTQMPPPSTQQLVAEILEGMDPEELERFVKTQEQEDKEGLGLRPPDCDEVARNPRRVLEESQSP